MSTNEGLGSIVDHDLKATGPPPPRYLYMFAERKATPDGAPVDEDPVFGFRGATGATATDAKFVIGILSGSLPATEHDIALTNLSAGIVGETDKVSVKPGLIFNAGSVPSAQVEGHVYYDSTAKELKIWTGTSWDSVGGGGEIAGTQWTLPVFDTATSIGDSMVSQDSGGTALTIAGSTTINSIVAGIADYDKFLVSHAGLVKFRTGTEVLSDIGGAPTGEVHILATTGPHSGTLPWTDLSKTSSALADLADVSVTGAELDSHLDSGKNHFWIVGHGAWNGIAPVQSSSGYMVYHTNTTDGWISATLHLPWKVDGRYIKITNVEWHYRTTVTGAYITNHQLWKGNLTRQTIVTVEDHTADLGNGSTGHTTHSFITDFTLDATYEVVIIIMYMTQANIGEVRLGNIEVTWQWAT